MPEMPEKNKNLPIGIGGEKLEGHKETLPVSEVANEIIWVNPHIQTPFALEIGKDCKLGMFLNPKPNESQKNFLLEVKRGHGRSGILGRVIFKDDEGRMYRDIDLKGVGNVIHEFYVNTGKFRVGATETRTDPANLSTEGILYLPYANHDMRMTEQFLEKGIRTYRIVAMIELKELIDANGIKISVKDARKQKLLEKDTPIIAIRAFGTKTRIADITSRMNYEMDNTKLALEDARLLTSQELGKNENRFSYDDYFAWFVKTIAQNVALMHKSGWVHGYLTEHNLTLDARIVDLDSVENTESQPQDSHKSITQDIDTVKHSLFSLEQSVHNMLSNSFYKKQGSVDAWFNQNYQHIINQN